MNAVELIAKKRDGMAHTRAELDWIAQAAATGQGMADYQLAAWLMAVVCRGMSLEETASLTLAMAASGERVNLQGLPKPWVDKHSTGGVGDKTTVVLLPMLAACGLTCIKMSGRGLGITGGTIDKLESIPGFRTDLGIEELKAQAKRIGLALTGQTPQLAPADGTLYALRDVTATIESIPLIASSILSKKIAGGAETIVIDVKWGYGAFMKSRERSQELADTLQKIGQIAGLKVEAMVSPMNHPLGIAVGNALEIKEAVKTLLGDGPKDFHDLCVQLAGHTLWACGEAETEAAGQARAEECLSDGTAAERAEAWFQAQGATIHLNEMDSLPKAKLVVPGYAKRSGTLECIDAGKVGQAVVDLGGGRKAKGESIDPSVGLEVIARPGDRLSAGQLIYRIHAQDRMTAEQVNERLQTAVLYQDS